jgi:hypothetical protein
LPMLCTSASQCMRAVCQGETDRTSATICGASRHQSYGRVTVSGPAQCLLGSAAIPAAGLRTRGLHQDSPPLAWHAFLHPRAERRRPSHDTVTLAARGSLLQSRHRHQDRCRDRRCRPYPGLASCPTRKNEPWSQAGRQSKPRPKSRACRRDNRNDDTLDWDKRPCNATRSNCEGPSPLAQVSKACFEEANRSGLNALGASPLEWVVTRASPCA